MEDTKPLTDLERRVRLFVYRHFIETGTAPASATIASAVDARESDILSVLCSLAELHALVLAPAATTVWMAHPFSAVPTAYPVDVGHKRYFANCAWDVAGILSLVGDGHSRTRCDDCGVELEVGVRDSEIVGEGVVHFLVPPRFFWQNVAFT